MENIFDKLFSAVEKLNDHVDGSLDEIRQHKAEIRDMRDDMYNSFAPGRYLRDDNCIIISAPNIIIGNVDKSGCAYDDSNITLRGRNISLQGVGMGASVEAKADNISFVAEDAGPDGKEAAVHPSSSTISIMGRNVAIESNNSQGTFSHRLRARNNGLSLHSDTEISIDSSLKRSVIKSDLTDRIADLSKGIATLTAKAVTMRAELKTKLALLNTMLAADDPFHEDEQTTYISALLIDNLSGRLSDSAHDFFDGVTQYLNVVTDLAEKKRQLTALKTQQSNLPANLAAQPNGCNIQMTGENIAIDCRDGDNKMRTDENSGVTINSPHTAITATGDDHRNIPDSDFTVQTQTITLDTANIKDEDKNKKPEEAVFEADGKVNILSKEISVQSIDYKKKDKDPYHREKLCEKGSLSIGVASLHADTADEKGKAGGEIKLNSKTICLQGADLDADSGKEKELSKESQVVVLTNKFKVGGTADDKVKASTIQLVAKDSTLQGEEKVFVYQGKEKSVDAGLKLSDKKTGVIGSNITLYGESKTHKMSIDALTSKKITSDSVDVKSVLSAPNSKWGQGVAQEGSAEKPDAKPQIDETKFISSEK